VLDRRKISENFEGNSHWLVSLDSMNLARLAADKRRPLPWMPFVRISPPEHSFEIYPFERAVILHAAFCVMKSFSTASDVEDLLGGLSVVGPLISFSARSRSGRRSTPEYVLGVPAIVKGSTCRLGVTVGLL
jgi:hypothetical protein